MLDAIRKLVLWLKRIFRFKRPKGGDVTESTAVLPDIKEDTEIGRTCGQRQQKPTLPMNIGAEAGDAQATTHTPSQQSTGEVATQGTLAESQQSSRKDTSGSEEEIEPSTELIEGARKSGEGEEPSEEGSKPRRKKTPSEGKRTRDSAGRKVKGSGITHKKDVDLARLLPFFQAAERWVKNTLA